MGRRIACLVTVGLLSIAMWGGNMASAQPPEGGRGPGMRGGWGRGLMAWPGGGLLALLHVESVQKDLQLTPEQIDKLKQFGKATLEGIRGQREQWRDLSQEDRRAKIEARAEEIKKKIEAILTTKQMERLKEIRLQAAGPAAVADPNLRKALHLTDEQKEKIKKLRQELGQQVNDLRKGAGDLRSLKPEERQKKMTDLRDKVKKLRQKALDDILALLTPEQKAEFQKRLGKKIELKPAEVLPSEDAPGFDLPARGPGK